VGGVGVGEERKSGAGREREHGVAGHQKGVDEGERIKMSLEGNEEGLRI